MSGIPCQVQGIPSPASSGVPYGSPKGSLVKSPRDPLSMGPTARLARFKGGAGSRDGTSSAPVTPLVVFFSLLSKILAIPRRIKVFRGIRALPDIPP